MRRTGLDWAAKTEARLQAIVVLPTPPLRAATAIRYWFGESIGWGD